MINIVHGYLLIKSFFDFTPEKEEVSFSENTIFFEVGWKSIPLEFKGSKQSDEDFLWTGVQTQMLI